MLGVLIVLSLEFVLMHLDVVHKPHYVGRLASQDGGRPWEPGGSRGGQGISSHNGLPGPPGNSSPELEGQSRQDRVVDPLSGATGNGDKMAGGTPNKLVPGDTGTRPQLVDGDSGGEGLSGPLRPVEEGLGDNLRATMRPPGTEERNGGYGDMRIAVLVPYSGPGLPVWFDAFTDLAAANRNLMDWIIFCEKVRGSVLWRVGFECHVRRYVRSREGATRI